MRPEKEFLVNEVEQHLAKSDYVFLTDFDRLNVVETAELRDELAKHDAEFHVVKNSVLDVAVKRSEYPDVTDLLEGQTAIVVGGKDIPGVAKYLLKFHKDKEKVAIKGGILSQKRFELEQVKEISEMPPLEVVQAKLLSLLKTPSQKMVILLNTVPQQMVSVLAAVPRDMLGVLKAKQAKG